MLSFYVKFVQTDRRTDGPTYGHILAQLSKPLLGSLVWYFYNIVEYKKCILTFRHRQIYTGRCERSLGVLRVRSCHIGITIILIIIVLKNLYPTVLILWSSDALDKFYGQNYGQNICWI